MDPFAVVVLCGLVVMVLAVYLVGRFYPGSGLNEIGMKTARQITETREQLEAEDLDQMLAAHNARRRARGQAEVTAGDLELRVAQDLRAQAARRESHMADHELDQLLEATNARRRARGEAPRTREQAFREFGPDSSEG